MKQPSGDKTEHVTERLRQTLEQLRRTAERGEELAKDSLRIAEQLYQQGMETVQQLENARMLAVKAEHNREEIGRLADNVQPHEGEREA